MPDPNHPYTPSPPPPFPPPTSHRQARIHHSLALLRSHPAVNPSAPHAAYRPPPHTFHPPPSPSATAQTVPSTVINALFNDLVRRELGIDPSATPPAQTRRLVETHLACNRSVAPKPSLSDPSFVAHLATGHSPSTLTDPTLLAQVAPQTVPKMHSPSAAQIHRAIEEAREQQMKLQNAEKAKKNKPRNASPKRPRSDVPVRRSTRKRARQDADMENSHSNSNDNPPTSHNPAEPPEVTALRPTLDAVRRTRSTSRKLRRAATNPTPSECCFCPDPELFGGEEIQSELIGPFVNRKGQAKLFVHFDCACWAPQVFADSQSGQLRGVYDEYCRGRKLKCSDCGGRGATIGCYVQRCKHVFHFRCLTRSGARRVERFFVAFCANHAHLGDKQSYKILMEAATIADVAEAHRRQDTTFGLDAPHSRYTQLRRRETELIFSRKLKICSHAGVFETSKVIFSHKRRRVLGKTDRLSLGDQPRSLLVSAVDVASGRLAYLSVAGKDKAADNMTAVEARAALASREKSSLFLLRSLRMAPLWDKEQISVIKNCASDVQPSEPGLRRGESDGKSQKESTEKQTLSTESAVLERLNETGEPPLKETPGAHVEGSGPDSPGNRRSKRRRVNVVTTSDDDDPLSKPEEFTKDEPQSAPLPSFKKIRKPAEDSSPRKGEALSSTQEAMLSPENAEHTSPQEKPSPEKPQSSKQNGRVSPNRKRKVEGGPRDGKYEETILASGRSGLAGKVKSAWETFLEEQLPKERLLRPDDPESVAMRNMARLWSLLSMEAREEYEEKARHAGIAGCDSITPAGTPDISSRASKRQKISHKVSKPVSKKISQPHLTDLGLFAVRDRHQNPNAADAVDAPEMPENARRKRQASVSLPRRSRPEKQPSPGLELLAVDWDDVLPTTLDDGRAALDHEAEPVRQPPPGRLRK